MVRNHPRPSRDWLVGFGDRPTGHDVAVPRISSFYGIAISMYWNEGVHARPHFHARYSGQLYSAARRPAAGENRRRTAPLGPVARKAGSPPSVADVRCGIRPF